MTLFLKLVIERLSTWNEDQAINKWWVFALICRFLGYKSPKTSWSTWICIHKLFLTENCISCDQMTTLHNQLLCNWFLITRVSYSIVSDSLIPYLQQAARRFNFFLTIHRNQPLLHCKPPIVRLENIVASPMINLSRDHLVINPCQDIICHVSRYHINIGNPCG